MLSGQWRWGGQIGFESKELKWWHLLEECQRCRGVVPLDEDAREGALAYQLWHISYGILVMAY